jgi:hypothetical protein
MIEKLKGELRFYGSAQLDTGYRARQALDELAAWEKVR